MSDAAPKATVAIPLFNSAPTIVRCIASAARQTLANIEILVADDGSTDDGPALARRMAADDARIRVIAMGRNGGKPRAMNRLVEQARGEWVAVLDADDSYEETRLQRLILAAERAGTEMAADNINYVDAGIGRTVSTGFDPRLAGRIVTRRDLLTNSNSFGTFDFGILKPVIRRDFLLAHGLTYYEDTRLAEDFYYLMNFFVANGRAWLDSEPLYNWTMPFGAVSRQWTHTGSGAWRYDYRQALRANDHFIAEMERRGEHDMVAMLRARSRQYGVMVHYIDAQRLASQRRRVAALATIAAHPATWPLLVTRVAGRVRRHVAGLRNPAATVRELAG